MRPPPFGKNIKKSPFFYDNILLEKVRPTPLFQKNLSFFLIRKFWIWRDPPAPLLDFLRKKQYFFMPPLMDQNLSKIMIKSWWLNNFTENWAITFPVMAKLEIFGARFSFRPQCRLPRIFHIWWILRWLQLILKAGWTPRTIQSLQLVSWSKVNSGDFCDNFGLELDRNHPLKKRKVWMFSSTGNFTDPVIWNGFCNQSCKI